MYSIDKSILSATPVTSFTKKGANTYSYLLSLPKSTANRKVSYYWTANELSGKKFTSPAEAPVIAGTKFGSYNEFVIGVDTVKPIVVYSNPLKYIFTSQTNIPLPTLLAQDNIGIDTIYMEYAINGAVLKGQGFKKLTGDTYSYSNAFNFVAGTLKSGDVVKYRIVVRDKAKIANVVNLPASGFYEFKVLGISASTISYVSNFDQAPSSDFYLKGFDISQPNGFSSPSLNSDHPYSDGIEESYDGGGGSDKFTNNDALLLKPIIIRSDTAKIYFDEVVLVEPGDKGEAFLNVDGTINRSFFDYVIVQGSSDLGKTWTSHAASRSVLNEPVCMASTHKHNYAKNGKPASVLLFSNPNTKTGRNHMTIKMSFDDGLTWPEKNWILLDEWNSFGYSCITSVDEHTIGILYEGSGAHMVFQKFSFKKMLK